MRVHSESGKQLLNRSVMVFLDGKWQTYVISADEEKGEIERYILRNGKPYYDHELRDVPRKMAQGKVEILLKPNASQEAARLYEEERFLTQDAPATQKL